MERCANSLFSLVKDQRGFPSPKRNGEAEPPARPGQENLRFARRGCSDAGREPTASDRSRRGMTVPLALAVHPARRAWRHQFRYRRFFSRYLMSLTWAESNPRAVPTSRLDRPAINISRATSVFVLV